MSGQQRPLASEVDCRWCQQPIYLAYCSDGRYRPFEKRDHPAADAGVWAWRKGWGMQETPRAPGKTLHYCPKSPPPGLFDPRHRV